MEDSLVLSTVFIGSEGSVEALSCHLVGIGSSTGQHEFGLDLKEVVDYFKQGNNDITEFGRNVYGCKQNCNLFFQNSHVECGRRQTNRVTYSLPKVSPYLATSHIFFSIYCHVFEIWLLMKYYKYVPFKKIFFHF